MKNYLVRIDDGRTANKQRLITARSPQDAANQYCVSLYYDYGEIQSEYEITVELDGQKWEATVETRVEFDVFIAESK